MTPGNSYIDVFYCMSKPTVQATFLRACLASLAVYLAYVAAGALHGLTAWTAAADMAATVIRQLIGAEDRPICDKAASVGGLFHDSLDVGPRGALQPGTEHAWWRPDDRRNAP